MKKTITLLLFAVLCIVGTSNAQNAQSTPIDELLDRLEQIGSYSGSISDHFTQEEQIQLRNHLSKRGATSTVDQRVQDLLNSSVERTVGNTSINATAPISRVVNTPQNVSTRGSSMTITHNVDNTVTDEILCTSPDTVADNIVWSEYDLDDDFGITTDFVVTEVSISIRTGGTNGIPGPNDPMITVNIYSNDGDFPGGTQTLQGTADYTVTAADLDTDVVIPVDATIPFGDNLLYEIVVPDHNPELGAFRLGVNDPASGESSWIVSTACGLTDPTPIADIGFLSTFIMSVTGDEATTGGGGPAYCIMNQTPALGSFDVADGSVLTQIGVLSPIVNFENAGSVDPYDNGTAYVIDNAGDSYSVDLATGEYTLLGNIPGGWTAGEFDSASGVFYALDDLDNLYTIDFDALTSTLIGNLGVAGGLPIGLAIDGSGNGYYYDLANDTFYGIDLATGAATAIGAIGFDANFGQGMFWDQATDTVYMTAFNNALFDSELRSVDIATGNTTLINQMEPGVLTQYAWSSTGATPGEGPGCTVEEDFEDSALPSGWSTVVNEGTCGDWLFGSDLPFGPDFDTIGIYYDDDDACGEGNGADPVNVSLLTDVYDTSLSTVITLDYDVAFWTVGAGESFLVEVFDGDTWQIIALYTENIDPIFTESLDLTEYANADFQVRYTYDDGDDWAWHAGIDNFCLSYDTPSGPDNDECDGAIAVECGDTVTGNTGEGSDSGGNSAPDLWYSFTGSGAAETVTLSLCDGGTDYDSYLRVWSDCDGTTEVAFNDDSCGLQSELSFESDGTSTYYIMVEGFASNEGNFSLAVTCEGAGVNDNVIEGLTYYPNPATDVINLDAQSNIERVAIYNILGQKVIDQNIDATSSQLNVANLATGAYLMEVSVEGKTATYKIVKN